MGTIATACTLVTAACKLISHHVFNRVLNTRNASRKQIIPSTSGGYSSGSKMKRMRLVDSPLHLDDINNSNIRSVLHCSLITMWGAIIQHKGGAANEN